MKRKYNPRTHFKISLNIFRLLSIILLIVFILLTPQFIYRLIKINKIVCTTQYGACSDELINAMNLTLGRDLKFSKNYLNSILKNDISINDYLIQYKITDRLDVDINLKKPKYVVVGLNNINYLVDKSGLVVAITNDTNLPKIVFSDASLQVGTEINSNIKFATELIDYLVYLFSINEIKNEEGGLVAFSKEGKKIIFPLEGDVKILIGSLRLIFSRLNDETEGIRMNEIREIDLRYNNPVLR